MKTRNVATSTAAASSVRFLRIRGGAFGLVLAGVGVAVWVIWTLGLGPVRASSSAGSGDLEIDQAIAATISTLATNDSAPQYLANLNESVAAVFPLLYPVLAERERLKDPATAAAEAASAYAILNPAAVGAELQKDPAFRLQCEQASRSIASGMVP